MACLHKTSGREIIYFIEEGGRKGSEIRKAQIELWLKRGWKEPIFAIKFGRRFKYVKVSLIVHC